MTGPVPRDGARGTDAPRRGLEAAHIPVGGAFWRALGGNGALVVGYALVAVHLGVLVLSSWGSNSADRRWDMAVQLSTILLPLLAFCLVTIGELIRRGSWGGPSGHKPDALLPQGTNTVTLRFVPFGWHSGWLAVSLVASCVLLWLIVADPHSRRFTPWSVNGIIASGVLGALLVSIVKKWVWTRPGARRYRAGAVHPALERRRDRSPSTTFWRTVGFRWRFDVWSGALGLIAVWLGLVLLLTRETFVSSAASVTAVASWLIPLGALLLGAGLWAATQFWRAGEDLASGESVA